MILQEPLHRRETALRGQQMKQDMRQPHGESQRHQGEGKSADQSLPGTRYCFLPRLRRRCQIINPTISQQQRVICHDNGQPGGYSPPHLRGRASTPLPALSCPTAFAKPPNVTTSASIAKSKRFDNRPTDERCGSSSSVAAGSYRQNADVFVRAGIHAIEAEGAIEIAVLSRLEEIAVRSRAASHSRECNRRSCNSGRHWLRALSPPGARPATGQS